MVRQGTPADREAVVRTLTAAFADDAPMCWFIPDQRRRPAMIETHFRASVPLYERAGAVWVSDDPAGAALWGAPGLWPFPPRLELPVFHARARVFLRRPRRALGGARALERRHPHEPHWYLDYIGVAPGAQGTGAGSALLEPMLARADAECMPAYLNASSERSRELYRRHGFEVTAEFRLPFGGPPLWRMFRTPR